MLLAGLMAAALPAVTIAPSKTGPYTTVGYVDIVRASTTTVAEISSTSTIEVLVRTAQAKYGLSDTFYRTLKCESDGWQNVQSYIAHAGGPNGREDSWGVAQIHLPDHPEVTKTEAMDPLWAVDWAAEEFAGGNAHLFSCYNAL